MDEKPGLGDEWVRLCYERPVVCTILDFCSANSPEEGKWGANVGDALERSLEVLWCAQ